MTQDVINEDTVPLYLTVNILPEEDEDEQEEDLICYSCGGSGEGPSAYAPRCSTCKGTGELQRKIEIDY